jgi:hypothetical protein
MRTCAIWKDSTEHTTSRWSLEPIEQRCSTHLLTSRRAPFSIASLREHCCSKRDHCVATPFLVDLRREIVSDGNSPSLGRYSAAKQPSCGTPHLNAMSAYPAANWTSLRRRSSPAVRNIANGVVPQWHYEFALENLNRLAAGRLADGHRAGPTHASMLSGEITCPPYRSP